MADQGFAPAAISSYGSSNPTYSILFLKQSRPTVWYFGMGQFLSKNFEFEKRSSELEKQGYKLISIAMGDSGEKIAAIWQK